MSYFDSVSVRLLSLSTQKGGMVKIGLLTMNQKEIDRIAVMRQMMDKKLKQSEVATLLRVSTRQVRRTFTAYCSIAEKALMDLYLNKEAKVHQVRAHRPCFGELIQLDASHHDWFEYCPVRNMKKQHKLLTL